jgi:hypothetical protein
VIKTFYIYRHYHADSGLPFYVGKGTRLSKSDGYRRAFDVHRRKASWKSAFAKHGLVVEVVAEFFAEGDALAFEADLIAMHGRRDLCAGTLINHTDGGEGCSGFKHKPESIERIRMANQGRRLSDASRRRISDALTGSRHPGYGRRQSAETSERKRVAMLGKNLNGRSVLDRSTGMVYESVMAASRAAGIPARTLANYLHGERKNRTEMEFA